MADVQQESMDKQAGNKGVFQGLKLTGRLKTVSTDLSYGWKTFATKAKKEVNTLNKKARKALTTYEEGTNVKYDQIYDCDFDTGYELWKRFQNHWVEIRNHTVQNITLAEDVDLIIQNVNKNWKWWDSHAMQLHDNLVAIPDIVAQVEIAQTQIEAIGEKISNVEKLLLEYEDAIERVDLEQKKYGEKLELSVLVEKRQKAFQDLKAKYEMTEEESGEIARVLERQASVEKQQVYEDAFMEQMEKYLQFGELDRPIAGSAGHDHPTEDISFDESDLEALREFLGPEEMDTVMRSQAVLSASQNAMQPTISNSNGDVKDNDAVAVKELKEDNEAMESMDKETKLGNEDSEESLNEDSNIIKTNEDSDSSLDANIEDAASKEADD